MAAYTLHVDAQALPGDPAALERAVVVRDGFAWLALIFGPLWFLWHRAWIGVVASVLAIAGLIVGYRALGVIEAYTWTHVLLALFFALEANAIRTLSLNRRGRPAADVVVADDRDSAEARLFARWLTRPAPRHDAVASAPFKSSATPVLGLFPEPESGR